MQIYIQKKGGHSYLEWLSKAGVYVSRATPDITQILPILICQWEISILKLPKKFNTEPSR